MNRGVLTVGLVAIALIAPQTGAARAAGSGPLTRGNLTMVSTRADGTSGPSGNSVSGAQDVAISADGTDVAFVSSIPAPKLVTDPAQVGNVTDHNTASAGSNSGDDVFLYQKTSTGSIVSLISWNAAHTGTANAPSYGEVLAKSGKAMAFFSHATDLTSGTVAAGGTHLFAWAPGQGPSGTTMFLVDEKAGTSDACTSCLATDPSIGVIPSLGAVVVFDAYDESGDLLLNTSVANLSDDQVYAHSIDTNTNTLVSADVQGDGVQGGADQPMIAADDPTVVFTALGYDLKAGFTTSNGVNIWTRNLLTSSTALISGSASGGALGTSGNHDPVISSSGSAVAWLGNDSDVSSTPFFTPAQSSDHAFYRVVVPSQPTVLVDTDHTGVIGCDSDSSQVGISADGTSVAFQSDCDDISAVPDTNGAADVFERTMAPVSDRAPRLLSVNDAGSGTGNADSGLCAPTSGDFGSACASQSDPSEAIAEDGTAVAFFTDASDIATPPSGVPPFPAGDVIVSYPTTVGGVTNRLLSSTAADTYPDGTSGGVVISADGSSGGFVSQADNLVAGDKNDTDDVFEVDLHNKLAFQPVSPVDEGAGSVTITVKRSGNRGTADSVEVQTSDGTATSPADYTAVDQTLSFPPGVTTETFTVPIVDDTDAEPTETFHVSMSSPTGAASAGPPVDVKILDNDSPAVVNPTIAAHLSSPHPKSPAGWYRSPVTIHFTCTPHSAALTGACPAVVTVGHEGRKQVVRRTIHATDGGSASATVTINLDRTAPTIRITHGAHPRCVAADPLSGVAGCHLTKHIKRVRGHRIMSVSATAHDKAGNVASKHATYRL